MTRSSVCISVLVACFACSDGPSKSKRNTTPAGKTPGAMTVLRTPGTAAPKPRMLSGPRSLGAPHAGFIDQVVLSANGESALSRDNQGGVRFWATLDGTSQPLPAPISGAVSMSIARRKADRWTAALIDSAGAVHFYRVGVDGSWAELSATKPSRKMAQVDVLPGGKYAVALREDRTIELVDVDSARSRARVQKRRFRPTQLRIDAKGSGGIAIEVQPSDKTTELSVYRLSIDTSAGTISVGRKLYNASEAVAVTRAHASLSMSSQRFAYLLFDAKTSKWVTKIVDLNSAAATSVDLPLPNHLNPTLGFVGNDKLLVNTQPSGQSWEIDTAKSNAVKPRAAPATHLGGVPAHAFGSKHHVVGLGTWLYVRDLEADRARYLGFESFDPAWAAVSDTGKYVAWATNRGTVYVESVSKTSARATRISGDQLAPVWKLAFAGDDRLITADSVGGIQLFDWKGEKVVDEVDSGGPVSQVEVSPDGKLLRIVRQIGQTWLFDITGDSLRGPYVLDDGSNRSGFLATAGKALWTIDPANKYRTYTLEEIRGNIDRKDMMSRGSKVGTRLPMAIDRRGLFYVFTPKGTRSELSIHELKKPKKPRATVKIPSASVFSVMPSPDGKKIAVMRDSGVLTMYDAATTRQLWSFSFLQNTSILSWSADSSAVAAASFSGAAVLAADTGKSMRTTCAPWFSVRETAPPNAFSSQNAQLCSR